MTIAIVDDRSPSLYAKGMKKNRTLSNSWLFGGLIILLASSPSAAGPMREVEYLYRLSTFTGTASVGGWPGLRVDSTTNEIYVLSDDQIRIFNQNGMEVYQLNNLIEEGKETQTIGDAAVKRNGEMIFLAHSYEAGKTRYSLSVANYRGDIISRMVLKNLPPELSDFQPDRMLYRDGLLYLANLGAVQIVVIDEEGSYQAAYDIKPLLKKQLENESRTKSKKTPKRQFEDVDWDMGDFSLDNEGNFLFTVPVLGAAYKLTRDLQLSEISRRGSGPGRFGIPASIITDGKGNFLVSDILRCVVMVFDKDFNYLGAFGGRHAGSDALIAPRGLVVDANNRLYISQSENMGVSVFQLIYNN